MKKYLQPIGQWLLVISVSLFSFSLPLGLGYFIGQDRKHIVKPIIIEKNLTEWQLLELAIIKTESNFDSLAIGKTDDLGLFQITPIYVEEVNRILGEERFSHEDAFTPTKALEMFNIYQDYKNPTHDIDKAISLHNPKGKGVYAKKVKKNLALIKEYENYRSLISR